MNKRYDKSAIFAIAGSILSISIGSGYATGQESLQFFSSFGLKGCIGAAIIMALSYMWVNAVVFDDARKLNLQDTHIMWSYYCGDKLGKILKYFCAIFIFCVYVVMLAGMGSTFHEYTGLPAIIGNIINVIALIISASIGRKGLAKLLGVIGSLIIVFAIIVGGVGLFANLGNISEANALIQSSELNRSCNWWYVSGLLYSTFMMINLIPFAAGLGKELHTKRDAYASGIIGGGLFGFAMLLMSLTLIANFKKIGNANVPTLVVARSIHPIFGFLFVVVLILGIYSTCLSLLYMVGNFICKEDDKSLKFRIGVTIATIVATIIGQFGSFAKLVNLVYPTTGWIGMVILLFVIYKKHISKKHINPETGKPILEDAPTEKTPV